MITFDCGIDIHTHRWRFCIANGGHKDSKLEDQSPNQVEEKSEEEEDVPLVSQSQPVAVKASD